MNRRFDQLKQRYAAWMLPAVFVWVMQPVGTALFCHDDISHDHSAHASETHSSGHQHGSGENHAHSAPHAQDTAHKAASTPVRDGASSELPAPANEACCCQPQKTPAMATAIISHSGTGGKSQVVAPLVAVLPLTYEPEMPPSVASRASPDAPSLYSQLCRSSFSNRAPPFSA